MREKRTTRYCVYNCVMFESHCESGKFFFFSYSIANLVCLQEQIIERGRYERFCQVVEESLQGRRDGVDGNVEIRRRELRRRAERLRARWNRFRSAVTSLHQLVYLSLQTSMKECWRQAGRQRDKRTGRYKCQTGRQRDTDRKMDRCIVSYYWYVCYTVYLISWYAVDAFDGDALLENVQDALFNEQRHV